VDLGSIDPFSTSNNIKKTWINNRHTFYSSLALREEMP
jgi:hypothetical protein